MTIRTDLSGLEVVGGAGFRAAIPALCAFFYFDRPVHAIAAEAAGAIEQYVSYVGANALKSYSSNAGSWKALNTRKLAKDLDHLKAFPADHDGMHLDYDAGAGGVPGDFGVALIATSLADQYEQTWANLLRFDFPATWLDAHPPDAFVGFVERLLAEIDVQTANVGFAFKRTEGSKADAIVGVNRKLPRYLGFDPCYSDVRRKMRNHTFTAHWINYVNLPLAEALGGTVAMQANLRGCTVREMPRGLLIRGARRPPVGDVNRDAVDIGCLPDVARVLKPLRTPIRAFGEPNFDASRWLARFDELASRPWDNANAAETVQN